MNTQTKIALSDKTIGFTSTLKLCFIHQSPFRPAVNFVPTEFPCSVQAVNNPDKSIIVELNGVLTAVSKEEFQCHGLTEITLKNVNNEWVKAE